LVLSPLIYEVSELNILSFNYQFITPIIFVLTSVLLISKIPTYSLKKIIVPRSSTVFLLFVIILLFGLLLIFTFKALVIGCLIYILAIPASIIHYKKLKKIFVNDNKYDEEEPEDVL
jgi:CDP-diacylglycerol--serine O-phosphatidyltransferase